MREEDREVNRVIVVVWWWSFGVGETEQGGVHVRRCGVIRRRGCVVVTVVCGCGRFEFENSGMVTQGAVGKLKMCCDGPAGL